MSARILRPRRPAPGRPTPGLRIAALLAAVAAGGCDVFTGPPEPESARVTVASTDVSSAVLVTSVDFLIQNDARPTLLTADTSTVSLPLDLDVALTDRNRFYVALLPVDTTASATYRMTVDIDDEEWYDETRVVGSGAAPSMEFLYRFREPVF